MIKKHIKNYKKMNKENNAAVAEEQKQQPEVALVERKEAGTTVYQVAGQDVKLSKSIVRNFLTKGNGNVNDQDIVQFISICKYNQLNPFLGEAFLIPFHGQPAQMVVSKEAFLKRAEANENYDGIEAGIIVLRNGEVVELDGMFHLKDDTLLGGWAKVYRKDRKFPFVSRICIEEYDKKQSLWKDKPATMICKVAKVQALREAFPSQLGAMYIQEEAGIKDVEYTDVTNEAAVGSKDKTTKAVSMVESAMAKATGKAQTDFVPDELPKDDNNEVA